MCVGGGVPGRRGELLQGACKGAGVVKFVLPSGVWSQRIGPVSKALVHVRSFTRSSVHPAHEPLTIWWGAPVCRGNVPVGVVGSHLVVANWFWNAKLSP
eukprot:172515-Chlamydomonas_euryale.AAC.3